MSEIYNSFLQIAGAIPFSSFLSGGGDKKKPKKDRKRTIRRTKSRKARSVRRKTKVNRRTNKRSLKRNTRRNTERTSRKLSNRRTARKTNRRTARKTNRRTARKVNRRTARKDKCSGYYTGKEPSPKGLGYFAHCTPLKVAMKGRDGGIWENKKYSKGKRWVKVV